MTAEFWALVVVWIGLLCHELRLDAHRGRLRALDALEARVRKLERLTPGGMLPPDPLYENPGRRSL